MENKNHFENAIHAEKISTAEEIILASDSEGYAVKENGVIPNAESTEETESSAMAGQAPKKTVRVSEIPSLRGENSKVFRMSDGTEQAVFYAEPIHVFNDETQCFEATDTVFTEKADAFVSGKNRFRAEFSKDATNDELLKITYGAHRVISSVLIIFESYDFRMLMKNYNL